MERLNLGCGPTAPPSWTNLDGSWNAWFARHRFLRRVSVTLGLVGKENKGSHWNVRPIVHDLRKPLPFGANTFSAVYASHVLEHLHLVDAQRLLRDCNRVLRNGGVLRIVVPDLHFLVAEYLAKKNGNGTSHTERMTAADHLNNRLGFRNPAPPKGNVFFKFYSLWKDFHSHKWMYDFDSLQCHMQDAGLSEVTQMGFRESAIPGIEDVEDPERVLNGAGVCLEGRKLGAGEDGPSPLGSGGITN